VARNWKTLDGNPPRIIAHRGASGYRPEHAAEAYALAFALGADVVEPDVLPSRDGVLFVRHDIDLAPTTDVAQRPEFAARAQIIDGRREWRIGDFDAAELDTLRCVQPRPARGSGYDGRFPLLRLSRLLEMARDARCGVEIELKHPQYFHSLGHDPVRLLESELSRLDLYGAESPVWLEGGDHAVLRDLQTRCGNRCSALIVNPPGDADLRQLAIWASAIAPHKALLWDGGRRDSGLVTRAHAAGLQVHAWTFRDDGDFAPFADVRAELDAAFALGVDALFCDFPDTAVARRKGFLSATR
jgi:glycerophosphoryl diester phosphodiesterase